MNNHDHTDLVLSSGDGASTDAFALSERSGRTEHKDLGAIAPTELGGITINRTKTGISPFVPIIKTPTYSGNSGTQSGFAVEIEDPEEETGYRHVGSVSKGYLLLPNEEVRELALEIAGRSGMPYRESRIFWDGSRFAHVIDFMERESVTEGDDVGLSLITRSSYDKSWRYDCALMGKRFLCDNGCLSGEFFARVSFKHLQGGSDGAWRDIVREGLSVVEHAPRDLGRFADGLRRLQRAEMTDTRLREVWQRLPSIGDTVKGQVMSHYVEHEEPTLFGLLNAGTNVLWHREKMTSADFAHNDTLTTALLGYAFEALN